MTGTTSSDFAGPEMPSEDTSAEHSLLVKVRDIDKAIGEVRDGLAFVADPGVLGDVVCELVEVQARFDGLRLQVLAQADAAGVAHTAGLRTMRQFVAGATTHCGIDTAVLMRNVKWLRGFPQIRDAAESGLLTGAHVRELRKLDNVRTEARLIEWQEFFVDAAREQTSFENFVTVCESWFIHTDTEGAEPKGG